MNTLNLPKPAAAHARAVLGARPARLLLLTAMAAALAACSTVPERNVALDDAQARMNVAQADPQVGALAPEELKQAAETLRAANEAHSAGRERATIDHLAYLGGQRVAIAQDTAASKAAQAVTAGAAAERDRLRLDVRTQEANTAQRAADASQQAATSAQQQLALSRQTTARQTSELAQAEAAAQVERDRLARRDARVVDLESQLKDLNAKKTERGMVVTLGDVLFDSGKSQLRADGSRNLAQLAEFFRRNPERSASIEGHTDSVGSSDSNQTLSDRRAGAVKAALVRMGVPAARLTASGYGKERPVADNDSATGRQMNRRVEIVFPPQANDVISAK
jgi:outer membrane protein OmpA-like peptidoglycan-associated protein